MPVPLYSKSVQCAFLINETADVSIRIHTDGVMYSLTPLFGTDDYGSSRIYGDRSGSNPDFLIIPLAFARSALKVASFSMDVGGIGPVHSGKLFLELHMWAYPEVSGVVLGTDRAVDVRFCFGSAKQLSSTDASQLVMPWSAGAASTPFPWPDN